MQEMQWKEVYCKMMNKIKQNQTPRVYFEINGFEFRVGEFYNYNPTIDPPKMEIRILKQFDCDALDDGMSQFEALLDKIKEWVSDLSQKDNQS